MVTKNGNFGGWIIMFVAELDSLGVAVLVGIVGIW